MAKEYQVEVWASYTQIANSPDQVHRALIAVFKREGLLEKNFEIKISRITKRGGTATEPEEEDSTKVFNALPGSPKAKEVVKPQKNEKARATSRKKQGNKSTTRKKPTTVRKKPSKAGLQKGKGKSRVSSNVQDSPLFTQDSLKRKRK